MSKSIVSSRPVKRPSTRPPSLSASVSSARISPDSAPSSDARSDEIGDSYYGNIVDLFAKRFEHSRVHPVRKPDPLLRYLATFDKDRLALEDAYASEATFSCRFISNSNSPLPYCFAKCNTGTLRGPTSIVQALSSFSRQILFVPGPELLLNVAIDVLRLSDMNYFASLTFNTIIEGVSVSVDMAFLLKERARHSAKQDLSRVLWTPFVVMSHQIILRS